MLAEFDLAKEILHLSLADENALTDETQLVGAVADVT